RSFYDGTVTLQTTARAGGGFSLIDPTRGNQRTVDMNNQQSGSGTLFTDADNLWGNFQLSSRKTIAVDAQFGTAETWDYYKTIHGRNGIANNGVGASNRVHFGTNFNNAFWSDS